MIADRFCAYFQVICYALRYIMTNLTSAPSLITPLTKQSWSHCVHMRHLLCANFSASYFQVICYASRYIMTNLTPTLASGLQPEITDTWSPAVTPLFIDIRSTWASYGSATTFGNVLGGRIPKHAFCQVQNWERKQIKWCWDGREFDVHVNCSIDI